MKKKIKCNAGTKTVEREVNFIPVRYIIAAFITILEILAIIAIVIGLCYYVPYFYIAAYITAFACELKIIASDDNPDYKVPWMLFVLVIPIAGFMLYFLFASRKLSKKYIKRLKDLKDKSYSYDNDSTLTKLNEENIIAYSQAKMLCKIADTNVFKDIQLKYFTSGEVGKIGGLGSESEKY